METSKTLDFQESLKILGIEDYSQRIFNSNSHGDLFHIADYIWLAEMFSKGPPESYIWFRGWFESVVKYAETTWERPESVFQHINKLLFRYTEKGIFDEKAN